MNVADPKVKPAVTAVEAGAFLGLSHSASYSAAKRGGMPTLRIGNRLLVPTHKLREMLGFHEERRSEPHAPEAASTSVDATLQVAIVAAAGAILRTLRAPAAL